MDQFLEALISFDKENIGDGNLKAIQPYLDNPEFDPDLVRTKSFAAAGLCSWAVHIVMFYRVFCDVEPKRRALARANADLSAAQSKLTKIKAKIKASSAAYAAVVHTYVHTYIGSYAACAAIGADSVSVHPSSVSAHPDSVSSSP